MKKIGITGQTGFVGKHLYNTLGLSPETYIRVEFEKEFFNDENLLDTFVKECDVIVHLAALNRDADSSKIYSTNIELAQRLIDSLIRTNAKPHLIFSSSTQEGSDNPYGNAKKQAREMLSAWASKSNAKYSGLIIPNVFGPFGNPFYNSVVSTFCHQLVHSEKPKIEEDRELKLIYISELVNEIIKCFAGDGNAYLSIAHTYKIKVTSILNLLERFKDDYLQSGIIPNLSSNFEFNMFNTFRSYIDIKSYFPVHFKKNVDQRGTFVEIIRLNVGGQVSFSTTAPGITRGNHFHTRKIERFAVIKGKALIQLRQIGTKDVFDFYLNGDEPSYVDMPIWYTHNIKNIGEEDLYTIFWINEFYNLEDPDTFIEIV